jgi:hypothetical protein
MRPTRTSSARLIPGPTPNPPQGPHALALHRCPDRACGRRDRRAGRTGRRQGPRRAGHVVRQPDQDDDQPGDLLHDRAGDRFGAQGRVGRQVRRSGARLLPGDVDDRPGHRPGGRQPHRPRDGPEHPRGPGGGRQTGGTGTRRGWRARILREHHPHVAAVVVGLGQRPADTFRRTARRVRAAGHGRHR